MPEQGIVVFLKPQGLCEDGREKQKIKRTKKRQKQSEKLVRLPAQILRVALPPRMVGFNPPRRVENFLRNSVTPTYT